MKNFFRAWCLALLSIHATAVFAAAADVQLANVWARATAPGQKTAAVYMDITSDTDAALVAAASTVAERVELHRSSHDDGVMRMRPAAKIELPARKAVKLAPGGVHLMLVNVKRPLREGDRVALVVSVQGRDGLRKIETEAVVRGLTDSHPHQHRH